MQRRDGRLRGSRYQHERVQVAGHSRQQHEPRDQPLHHELERASAQFGDRDAAEDLLHPAQLVVDGNDDGELRLLWQRLLLDLHPQFWC